MHIGRSVRIKKHGLKKINARFCYDSTTGHCLPGLLLLLLCQNCVKDLLRSSLKQWARLSLQPCVVYCRYNLRSGQETDCGGEAVDEWNRLFGSNYNVLISSAFWVGSNILASVASSEAAHSSGWECGAGVQRNIRLPTTNGPKSWNPFSNVKTTAMRE